MKTLRYILLLLLAIRSPGLLCSQAADNFVPYPSAEVSAIALQPDGKFLIGGFFSGIAGQSRKIARFNPDGTLDVTFNAPSYYAQRIAIQSDGKILISGEFTLNGGAARNYIARLNADGSLDSSFNPNPNSYVMTMTIQPDGRILVAGIFTVIGGQPRNRIARLNSDGSLDMAFNPNASARVDALILQRDGKIVIGGFFSTVAGIAHNTLARLNSDGTLDGSFNPIVSGWYIKCIAIQPDGKIVFGGNFTDVNGQARNRIARVGVEGSLDAGFNPNANERPEDLVLQADGRILVAGHFTSVGGVSRPGIARLNTDGSVDNSFNTGVGGNSGFVNCLALQADGNILLGGDFMFVGGVARPNTARVINNIPATTSLTVSGSAQIDWIRGGATPEIEQVSFDSWNGSVWVNVGQATRVSGGWRMSGLILPPGGQIRARGRASGGLNGGNSSLIEQIASYAPPLTVTSLTPSVGSIAGGTSVTTTGTGFTGASAVSFGSTPATSFTVNSDTSITAITPANAAGTVDVSVTATAGSGTGTGLFTYYGPPVASFTASPNPAAPNQIIGFNGGASYQSAAGGSITAYQWNWGDGSPAGSGATPSHSYALFGSYQVQLTVTDNFGQTASTTSMVTVNQGNIAPVANAGGPYTIRLGQDLTLNGRASTDANAAQGDIIATYAWDLDNNGSFGDITGANPTVSWPAIQRVTGTSTIALRVTDSMGATNTATTTLTVNPLPSATTSAVSGITTTGATLNGTVNANGTPSSVSFEFGLTTSYGNSIAATPGSVSGNTATSVSAALTGLAPHTQYHYRVKVSWSDGTSVGNDGFFTTANTAPTFAGYSVTTPWQAAATISLGKLLTKAADADGDALSVTAAGPASAQGGTAVLQAGSILYTPPAAFSGTDTFSVTLADVHGASVSGTVTVSVGPNPTSGGQGVNPPQITILGNGDAAIGSQGIPGRTYLVQRSTNLSTWATIGTVIAASNGVVSFIDENPPQPSAFYRLGRNVPEMNFWGNGSDGALATSGNISFSSVQDGDVVVKQFSNLTINAGHTLTTSTRCRGLVIYVNGDCTINGTLSMTARGANVNPTLANSIPATGIRLARFKYGANETLAASDLGGTGVGGVGAAWRAAEAGQLGISGNGRIYTIARDGGAGGIGVVGLSGGARGGGPGLGTSNGTGGGAAGGTWDSPSATGGSGSTGTCYSGGSGGGGGGNNYTGGHAALYGSAGGQGLQNYSGGEAGGGAGNPGGLGNPGGTAPAGQTGTGGLLALIVKGNLTIGSGGAIHSKGMNGGINAGSGGGSGGGRILLLHAGSCANVGSVSADGGNNAGTGAITIEKIDP